MIFLKNFFTCKERKLWQRWSSDNTVWRTDVRNVVSSYPLCQNSTTTWKSSTVTGTRSCWRGQKRARFSSTKALSRPRQSNPWNRSWYDPPTLTRSYGQSATYVQVLHLINFLFKQAKPATITKYSRINGKPSFLDSLTECVLEHLAGVTSWSLGWVDGHPTEFLGPKFGSLVWSRSLN